MPPATPDHKRNPQPADTRPGPTPPPLPLLNYTLSTICPVCSAPTIRRACKVRCERCGFVWDCSEL